MNETRQNVRTNEAGFMEEGVMGLALRRNSVSCRHPQIPNSRRSQRGHGTGTGLPVATHPDCRGPDRRSKKESGVDANLRGSSGERTAWPPRKTTGIVETAAGWLFVYD